MLDMVELKRAISGERRASPRVVVDRPCKVHDPRSGKYIVARARDLSTGGVCIEIDHPTAIGPGDEVFLGIAQKRRQMFLRSDDMLRVRIVRVLGTPSGGAALAGRFCDQPGVAETLSRAA